MTVDELFCYTGTIRVDTDNQGGLLGHFGTFLLVFLPLFSGK